MSENTGGMKVRYRIKTEDEFIDEYGRDWKYEVDWCIHGRMDYLLGKEVDKNTEHQIDGWWIHEEMIIEITEKTMTEKIQMTEEQFENIYSFFHNTNFNEGYTATLHHAKLKGYIRKSELEILVEKAEDYYRIYMSNDYNKDREKEYMHDVIQNLNNGFQALKKSHPEFNK